MLKKQVFSFPLLLSSGKNLVPIRCDHVWRESSLRKRGETVQHQVAFPISHLVAIPFGTTQKSEICLMTSGLEQLEICHIHKIQKHGYVSTFCCAPLYCFLPFFSYIGLSFLLLCFFILMSAFFVGWALIKRWPEVFFIAVPHLSGAKPPSLSCKLENGNSFCLK